MPSDSETVWIASPLKGVSLGDILEVSLGNGLALISRDARLEAATNDLDLLLNRVQFRDLENAKWFLVLRIPQSLFKTVDIPQSVELLQDALMACQIVKPIETHGLVFHGIESPDGRMRWQGLDDRRWPMSAGHWARLRTFDAVLLKDLRAISGRVRQIMTGSDIAKRNAVHLLQLALEHPHPYIACLLAVTGIEAILDSENRWDFETKLCNLLGASTFAFPDWNSPEFPPMKYTVRDLAVHLYTLRSKIAHGANLASAAQDKNSPVNLSELKEYIPEGEPVRYAILLCESSIYLLGQVLQKVVREGLEVHGEVTSWPKA
jgi:hypothetical protein